MNNTTSVVPIEAADLRQKILGSSLPLTGPEASGASLGSLLAMVVTMPKVSSEPNTNARLLGVTWVAALSRVLVSPQLGLVQTSVHMTHSQPIMPMFLSARITSSLRVRTTFLSDFFLGRLTSSHI